MIVHTGRGTAALLILLLVATAAQARQTDEKSSSETALLADAGVGGEVVDDIDGTPIAGALVYLDDRVAETNEFGLFFFPDVPPGSHLIAAVAPGCDLAGGDLRVNPARDVRVRLVVEPTAERESGTSRSASSGRMFRRAALAEFGGGSLLEALDRLLPNMFEVSGDALAVRARGVSGASLKEPLVVIDGFAVEGHVAMILAHIPASSVTRVEVDHTPGAGLAHRPGGAEAVIHVTTRDHGKPDPEQSPESCRF